MSRLLRAELVLPWTIVAAAVVLAASEFMTTFLLSTGPDPQEALTAAERHHYALLILAIFAVIATVFAIATGLRAAAFASAVFGVAALLLFLLIDLPDAGKAGPLGNEPAIYFVSARADPQAGFWLEAVASVVLGLATVAFATLSSSQLRAPAAALGFGRGRDGPEGARPSRSKGVERPTPAPASLRHAVAKAARKRNPERRTRDPEHGERPFDAESGESGPSSGKRTLPGWLRRPRSNGG